MITDIPTPTDFHEAGINLLNLAWDSTVSLLIDRIESPGELNTDYLASDEYWKSAQPILTSSLSLIQQSVEFFLKGKIAEVSPYLLITSNPANWPKGSDKGNASFSDFRTIDSQDLIRVHDIVSKTRLSDPFRQWYEELRRLRNKLMHTVDTTISVTDQNVLVKILEACDYCINPRSWIRTRNQYLRYIPSEHILNEFPPEAMDENVKTAYRLGKLQREIMTVIEYLEPRYSKKFFGFNKRERRYICLYCLSCRENEYFFEYKDLEQLYLHSAQIVDRISPSSNTICCIFCNGQYLVERKQCSNCGENMIDAQNGLCLSCTPSIPIDVDLQTPIESI